MQIPTSPLLRIAARIVSATMAFALTACGSGGDGPAVRAQTQSIQIAAAPAMTPGSTTSLQAIATSGLPVQYTSDSPRVCTVNGSGEVSALSAGTCLITIRQDGNPDYAPAPPLTVSLEVQVDPRQTLTFAPAPELSLGGSATVAAASSAGLPVRYGTRTPTVCAVDAGTGVVTDLTAGDCIVTADQPGNSVYLAALQVTQSLPVVIPTGVTAPAAPTGVTVTSGDAAGTVVITASGVSSGGSPILHYTVRATGDRVVTQVASLPATVSCGGSCDGLGFTLSATNALGAGSASASTDIVTRYEVVTIFREPDTQPRDTIFTGSFLLNATTGEVTALQGTLTESMTGSPTAPAPGYGMTLLTLSNPLSTVRDDALGGWLVTTFLRPDTSTFTSSFGGDGWTPGTGFALYAGFPTATNPSAGGVGNAYVRIFVNATDPTAALTQARIDKLAYADCTAGGMMGATCMTGTTVAGYGTLGSMSGHPVSQVIRKAP
ncbi:MAG: hypothetical protein U1F52_03435 [Burkholderiales bacterium]